MFQQDTTVTFQLQVGVVFADTPALLVFHDLLENSLHNGHHHRNSQGVLDPQGEERTAGHEAQHQPGGQRRYKMV